MNITLDQYLLGLEQSAKNLPSLLKEWHTLDDDLVENYIQQLIWIIEAEQEALLMAIEDNRFSEAEQRIITANTTFRSLNKDICDTIGDTIGAILMESMESIG